MANFEVQSALGLRNSPIRSPRRERDPAFVGPLSDLSGFLFALFLISLGLFPGRGASAGLTQDFQVPFTPGLAFVGLFPAFDAESQFLAFFVSPLTEISAEFPAFRSVHSGPVVLFLACFLAFCPGLGWNSSCLFPRAVLFSGFVLFVQALAAPTAAWLGWSLDTPWADS